MIDFIAKKSAEAFKAEKASKEENDREATKTESGKETSTADPGEGPSKGSAPDEPAQLPEPSAIQEGGPEGATAEDGVEKEEISPSQSLLSAAKAELKARYDKMVNFPDI